MRVRYRAERREIERRYAEYEITGPAEVREVDVGVRAFTPHAGFAPTAHRPIKDPPKDQPPRPEKDPPDGDPPVKEPPEEAGASPHDLAELVKTVDNNGKMRSASGRTRHRGKSDHFPPYFLDLTGQPLQAHNKARRRGRDY